MIDRSMTIVFTSFDGNVDVIERSLHYFNLAWPDCPYKVIVSTEERDINTNYEVLKCGKGVTWTNSVLRAVEQIQTPYVFLIVDDYFLFSPVNTIDFENIISFMEKNGVLYLSIPLSYLLHRKYEQYKDNPSIEQIPKNRVYGVTIGCDIWKKDELLRVFGDGTKSAWDIENDYLKYATQNTKDNGFVKDYVICRAPIFQYAHMVSRGKWLRGGLKTMKAHNLEVDPGVRDIMSLREHFYMRLLYTGTRIIPAKHRRFIKKALSKVGFKFMTEW